jgi:ElaB/YqjD/DUF883 family membrane-anchored ribosome-binding protein
MKIALHRSSAERRADRIVEGLGEMAAKAQELMTEAGSNLDGALNTTTSRLFDAGTRVSGSAQRAARVTDAYVRENPWKVLGVAAAVGALLAVLLTRR